MKIAVYESAMQYQADMSSVIMDAERMIDSFKAVKQSTCSLNGGVGNLNSAVENIDKRILDEESKKESAIEIKNKTNDFLLLAKRIDNNVSALVNKNKEELYSVNPWLRPPEPTTDDRNWAEKAWDWLCGKGEEFVEGTKKALKWVGDTAKKAWDGLVDFYEEHKKIIDTVLIVVGAVAAIAVVIGTGGAALIPLLTAWGCSAGVATALSVAVAVTAVVTTVASSTMNIIDTWCEIDNPMFNAWQKGLGIASTVTNLFYSAGTVYNTIKNYKPDDIYSLAKKTYSREGSQVKISYDKSTLKDLKKTENFGDDAIEHIFEGNVKRGKAGGYHSECIEDTAGKVINGTEVSINDLGVYKAKVEVNGIPKTANEGYSTFFPRDMKPQQVVDAVNEAYDSRVFIEGTRNTYRGFTKNGLEIEMYINANGKIISAFPKG